jgi:ABC-type nitrate/sulfonate/bicarbonate transport system substrate-binding protein
MPKPEKADVVIGVSSVPAAANGTQILPRVLDLYGKYGLQPKFMQFNGAGPAMQALLAGQVDVVDTSAAPLFATIGTSSETQLVFVGRSNNSDILYSQTNIKTAADLKGKNVAISSFGSNSYAGAIFALKALGLTDKDVTITTVGNDTQRLAALKGGSVAAAILDVTQEKTLNGQGFNSLVRIGDIRPPVGQPSIALAVPVTFQKSNPNTVLALVAAWLEATQTFRTMPIEQLAPLMAKELNTVPLDTLKDQLTLAQQEPFTPKDGMCLPADIQAAKDIAQSANPSIASVDPLKVCNNGFLLKLKDLGLQKRLGIPGY